MFGKAVIAWLNAWLMEGVHIYGQASECNIRSPQIAPFLRCFGFSYLLILLVIPHTKKLMLAIECILKL